MRGKSSQLATFLHLHLSGTHELSCQQNPLIISVTHSQEPSSLWAGSMLLNFSSSLVGITAVALRTLAVPGPSEPPICLLQHKEGHDQQPYRYCLPRFFSGYLGFNFNVFTCICLQA